MAVELKHLKFEVENEIAIMTLNRPEARNALSEEMRVDMDKVIPIIKERAGDDIKVLVITGAGNAFSAGGDIKGMQQRADHTPPSARRRMRSSHNRLYEIANLELPVIAAVNGAAAGAGFCFALMADFILATPRSRFAASFNRLGLVPDWAGLYFLPRIVGLQKAKELIFTCRLFDAAEAKEMGIVYDIYPEEGFTDQVKAFAGRFRGASTSAIGISKNILNQSFNLDHRTMLELEAMAQSVSYTSDYHRQAVARFVNKEAPMFNWEAYEKKAAE
jgi:2-(1,2-epoxy-1,2-dihydrophenyl)acetyl-CoA isomerase